MDMLRQYGNASDSSDSGEDVSAAISSMRRRAAASAPPVDTSGLALVDGEPTSAAAAVPAVPLNARTLHHNPTVDALYGGGASAEAARSRALRNHASGHVEDYALSSAVFDQQYSTFHAHGVAEAPDGRLVGDVEGGWRHVAPPAKRPRTAAEAAAARGARERARAQRAALAAAVDPDAAWVVRNAQPWAEHEARPAELTDEQRAYLEQVAKDKAEKAGANMADKPDATSVFHGKEQKDWQGRPWTAPPKDKRKQNDVCHLPKRWVHTWSGHTKGVNALRFFPEHGHLLLSAGLDSKVKIWDVYGSGKCLRTYMGHDKGVRDITFNTDGSRFLSTAYDKKIQVWDTETGQVIRTIQTDAMFYTVRLHPHADKQNVLLAGASDKKIYQFDLDSGDLVQKYEYHLGAVNTLTYIDDGRRFVSTADDKTIRVWELGIPVQVKYIADPTMHSMPACAVHPSGKQLCYQSMDNQIVTYHCHEKFRPNRKKTFKGHLVAGNACQVNFSPDGRFLMSGDATGKLFFWDWSHPGRILRTIPAHEKVVCIGCEWHPLETSKVATCGWDGLIKYWD